MRIERVLARMAREQPDAAPPPSPEPPPMPRMRRRRCAISPWATPTPSAKAVAADRSAGRPCWCSACASPALTIDEPQIVAVTGWTTDELAAGHGCGDADAAVRPGHPADRRQQPVPRPSGGGLPRAVRAACWHGPSAWPAIAPAAWWWCRFRTGASPALPREQGRDRAADRRRTGPLQRGRARRGQACRRAASSTSPTSRAAHPELVAADGLHPSAAQYARWVERIAAGGARGAGADQQRRSARQRALQPVRHRAVT